VVYQAINNVDIDRKYTCIIQVFCETANEKVVGSTEVGVGANYLFKPCIILKGWQEKESITVLFSVDKEIQPSG